MISVSEARTLITENITLLQPVDLALPEAAGQILARDMFAVTDVPPFEQSSMDGYALRFEDKDRALIVCGELAAGTSEQFNLLNGETARVFTGAPLPDGADTVVMQEKVLVLAETIIIQDLQLKRGNNVRHRGAEAKAGSLAIGQGSYLSPAAIGFIAGLGIMKVSVYPLPTVSIIITGDELQTPGVELSAGQVYESNSYSLVAALQQAGIKNIQVNSAKDDLAGLQKALETALLNSNVVLLTGGVSVGDYDFVVEAAKLCNVHEVFHKVKQRPGKPLFFGRKDPTVVFGLPGNPSSVLSCFYNYVLPALELLSRQKHSIKKLFATLTTPYSKPKGLTHFLKGFYENGAVIPLTAQESYRLSSFSQANCLICLEEDKEYYAEGEIAEVHLLPGKN